MREVFKSTTDERPAMIVFGIIILFLLVVCFILYLFFLHRISLVTCLISILMCFLIYIPRLLIIWKLKNKDKIRIFDNSIFVNGLEIPFMYIKKYKVEEKKTVVVFVFNNNLITYNEAKFTIFTKNGQISFTAIGSEKIKLLKEFLDKIINNLELG